MEKKKSAELKVEEILLSEIMTGQLKAGDFLKPERVLSEVFGFSRPVIHKAIIRLESKGLLTIIPRRGVLVEDFRISGRLSFLDCIYDLYREAIDPNMNASMLQFVQHNLKNVLKLVCERDAETRKKCYIEQKEGELLSGEDLFEYFHRFSLYSGNIIYPMLLNEFRTGVVNVGRLLLTHAYRENFLKHIDALNDFIKIGMTKNAFEQLEQIFKTARDIWLIEGVAYEK